MVTRSNQCKRELPLTTNFHYNFLVARCSKNSFFSHLQFRMYTGIFNHQTLLFEEWWEQAWRQIIMIIIFAVQLVNWDRKMKFPWVSLAVFCIKNNCSPLKQENDRSIIAEELIFAFPSTHTFFLICSQFPIPWATNKFLDNSRLPDVVNNLVNFSTSFSLEACYIKMRTNIWNLSVFF